MFVFLDKFSSFFPNFDILVTKERERERERDPPNITRFFQDSCYFFCSLGKGGRGGDENDAEDGRERRGSSSKGSEREK